jgi:hypothetical protein
MRVWHTLCNWLKLIRSVRAAGERRIGMEISPNDKKPFHVEAATVILQAENIRISAAGLDRQYSRVRKS